MKLLLTSVGASNDSIRAALVELLGKPIEEASAVAVPTAMYAYPEGVRWGWESIKSFADMGWREMGVLELTALPTLEDAHWLSVLEAADAILVGGGVTGYLSYWFQESGLAERLPPLLRRGLVYVGVSAGSMVATPGLNVDRERLATTGVYYDDEYDEGSPAGAGSDAGLGLVDFAIRPHLGSEDFPGVTLAAMEAAAAKLDYPLYAIDDQTALQVVGDTVEVVSEGEWHRFEGATDGG
ncbi:MAG TPA: Type 1 glutamine amidotransferase-like domain-containing protein [Microlunatus sp.]